jgi:LuxR family transcriptional regulator, quorum-sensing system regulator BjaR1
MNARMYRDIAQAISAIWVAPDPSACSRLFAKAIAAFDIHAFASGETDLAAFERTVFYATGWPDSWHKFYVGSGLIRRDPLLTALKQSHGPFTWSELRREGKWPAIGTRGLQAVAEHGWTEGLVVPIPRGDQRFGLVSLLCRRDGFDADEKAALAMLSYCFHERLRNLVPKHGFAVPPIGLTEREIDALRLIARGATDRDVARKLGISLSTAHEHFEKAKRKLKASTRAEATAIAVSLAIIAS